jgi:hypothetical protein|tara:strand:- start:124 stop:456 length:333 start_codon:yes stop_codon:yes gene_type:complete
MAFTILAHDLPGSSYTGFSAGSGNYRKERAVRRFLVDGVNTFDQTSLISAVINAIDDSSGNDLHPQAQHTNGNLPMQEVTIQKIGNRPLDGTSNVNGALYVIEAVYYYAL